MVGCRAHIDHRRLANSSHYHHYFCTSLIDFSSYEAVTYEADASDCSGRLTRRSQSAREKFVRKFAGGSIVISAQKPRGDNIVLSSLQRETIQTR